MEPLIFEPYLRPQVWGGRRLGELFGKILPGPGPFGESWELSGHPLHGSLVAEGPLKGVSLNDLCARHGQEIFGSRPEVPFPLLVKLLDCNEKLSIQVHPSDGLAARFRPGEKGKTEVWIVLSVSPGGTIYAGLQRGVTRAELEKHLDAGTVEECLHAFTPDPGDVLFLPAGTVHAIGGGVMLAEVQQTSDVTFRLFDWNRKGADGKGRPLHREESLASIDWNSGPVSPVKGTPLTSVPAGVSGEHLVACAYFRLERFRLTAPFDPSAADELAIWILVEGAAELSQIGTSYRRRCRSGETVLIPAVAGPCRWTPTGGPATLLRARLG